MCAFTWWRISVRCIGRGTPSNSGSSLVSPSAVRSQTSVYSWSLPSSSWAILFQQMVFAQPKKNVEPLWMLRCHRIFVNLVPFWVLCQISSQPGKYPVTPVQSTRKEKSLVLGGGATIGVFASKTAPGFSRSLNTFWSPKEVTPLMWRFIMRGWCRAILRVGGWIR